MKENEILLNYYETMRSLCVKQLQMHFPGAKPFQVLFEGFEGMSPLQAAVEENAMRYYPEQLYSKTVVEMIHQEYPENFGDITVEQIEAAKKWAKKRTITIKYFADDKPLNYDDGKAKMTYYWRLLEFVKPLKYKIRVAVVSYNIPAAEKIGEIGNVD